MKCIKCGRDINSSDTNKVCAICMNSNSLAENVIYGWICPKCGRVYSSHVNECVECNNKNNTLKVQAEIVRQRIMYHFALIDGSFSTPVNMPFMKEFLNEINKLLHIIEKEK